MKFIKINIEEEPSDSGATNLFIATCFEAGNFHLVAAGCSDGVKIFNFYILMKSLIVLVDGNFLRVNGGFLHTHFSDHLMDFFIQITSE
jgi:hypothetical protein